MVAKRRAIQPPAKLPRRLEGLGEDQGLEPAQELHPEPWTDHDITGHP